MAMVMSATRSAHPAGFWPRAYALGIDVAAVNMVLALLALLLFEPTGGLIRIGELPLVKQSTCRSLSTELSRGSGAEKTTMMTCESALFDWVHDRRVEIRKERSTGAVTSTRVVSYPVDAQGQPTRALYLDQVLVLLLMAYLAVAEWWFGTTLGKRLVGLRVERRDGGPLRLGDACKRLLRFAPALPVAGAAVLTMAIEPTAAAQSTAFWIGTLSLYALAAALGIAVLVNFATAVGDWVPPWHDRWGGTKVVKH